MANQKRIRYAPKVGRAGGGLLANESASGSKTKTQGGMAKSDEVWMLECHSNSCNILQRAGKSGGAECQEVLRQSIWTNFRLTSSKRTRNATGWSSGGENPTEKG